MTKIWIRTVLAIVARACVLLAFSEFLFFNEGPVRDFLEAPNPLDKGLHIAELVLFYCLPGSLLLALEPMMTTWPRSIFVGAFVGWSIEAAMVPVAYENPPFSFFWTSVSWHAMVDVCLGWVLLRRIFFVGRIKEKLLIAAALGGLTAIWSTWAWSDLELEAALFTQIICVAVALLIVGFCMAGLTAQQPPLGRYGLWMALGANIAFWGIWAVIFVPISLGLAVLAAVNGVFLTWASAGEQKQPAFSGFIGIGSLVVAIPCSMIGFWAIEAMDVSQQIGEIALIFVAFGGVVIYTIAVFYALRNRFAR